MGQSGSAHIQTIPRNQQAAPLPEKKPPPPRPESPPTIPPPIAIQRTPSYVVPQNLVMPGGILPKKKLRPVSQEISKIYPEFADIFPQKYDDDEFLDLSMETASSGESEKENREKEGDSKDVAEVTTLPRTSKDSHRSGDHNKDVSNISQKGNNANGGLKRSNSLDRSASASDKGHRRNHSVTRSLMNEQNTIFEDPREHLYDQWRKNPSGNPLPSAISLPIKNKFDIDVSYNMTYAQLAEYRRKTNMEELERNTGINLNQMSEDLNTNKQDSPFNRHYSIRASSRSTSTTSSDAGVSKQKKKRAPPPPVSSDRAGAQEDEPPIDYNMDSVCSKTVPQNVFLRKSSICSTVSTTSSKNKMAPPPPSISQTSSTAVSPATTVQDTNSSVTTTKNTEKEDVSLDTSKNSAEQDALEKLDALLKSQDNSQNNMSSPQSDAVENVNVTVSQSQDNSQNKTSSPQSDAVENVNVTDSQSAEKSDNKDAEASSSSDTRNTETVCAKDNTNSLDENNSDDSEHEKPKVSVISEKPKSPQDLFKEQLARAYEERQERNKILQEKEKQNAMKLSEQKQEEAVNLLKKMSRDLDKKWLAEHKEKQERDKHPSEEDKDETSESNDTSVFSDEWTPEHDLDPDDDIDDPGMPSLMRHTSQGFKSSIIPPKVKDLKSNDKQKKGKYNKKSSECSSDEKHKYGSIRKFKSNIRKSVQNAFGSISNASGKLLKSKSQNLTNGDHDTPINWQLASEKKGSSAKHSKGKENGHVNNRESIYQTAEFNEDDSAEDVRLSGSSGNLTETELGYVNGNKESNFEDSQDEEEMTTTKIHSKKKFRSQKDTEKIQELISEKIHEKEHQIELEKIRQLEMEKELQRLKTLENQEQLQRLQTARLQQQLQFLQQQQQQSQAFNGVSLSAAALPAPGRIQVMNSVAINGLNHPGLNQHQAISSGVTPAPYPQDFSMPFMNVPHINGNVPNLNSFDINYLSNVMKMNGIQPPSTTHQWAYLLNSINVPSPFEVKAMSAGAAVGPDLSKVFAASSVEEAQVGYLKKVPLGVYPSNEQSYLGYGCNNLINPAEKPMFPKLLEDFKHSAKSELVKEELKTQPPVPDKPKLKTNPVYYSSDEDDSSNGLSPAKTNMAAHIKVGDHRDIPAVVTADMKTLEVNGYESRDLVTVNGHHVHSDETTMKIYGPNGLQPVSFQSRLTASSHGDESSGAEE